MRDLTLLHLSLIPLAPSPSTSPAEDTAMANSSKTIRQQAETVAKLFDALTVLCEPVEVSRKAGSIVAEDQVGRFRIWAGNIGVHANGHASLDYRLRDSPEPRELMFELFDALQSHINRAIEINRSTDSEDVPSVLDVTSNGHRSNVYGSSVQSSAMSSFNGTETDSLLELIDLPPLEDQMRGIEQTIDRLYRLSLAIRRPSLLGQDRTAAKFVMRDEEGNQNEAEFQSYAFQRAKMEFSEAPDEMLLRLSQAITFRRRRFLYRIRHQIKLGGGGLNAPKKIAESTVKGSTAVRTETGTQVLRLSPPELNPARNGPAKNPFVAASATSASAFQKSQFRAGPVFDSFSTVSTAFQPSTDQRYVVTVPEAPPIRPGSKEFECPYCCLILPIEEAKGSKWRRHVINDIEPYICLYKDCPQGHTLYREKAAWTKHMQEKHTSQWSCTATGHPTLIFGSEENYEEHMRDTHSGAFTEGQLPWLKKQSRSWSTILFTVCPLCGLVPSQADIDRESKLMGIDSARPYDQARLISSCLIKHIGYHLEHISLISLPWQDTFKQIDPSERSASSKVQRDSIDNETENTDLVFEDDDYNKVRWDTSRAWEDEISTHVGKMQQGFDARLEWGFLEQSEYFGHARDPILQTFLRRWYCEGTPVSYNRGGVMLPVYIMPANPSVNFFGRELELKAIEDALLPGTRPVIPDQKPISWPNTFAIHAPGGMGKTQIATQFILRHRDKYDAVFWVYADDQTKLSQDFRNIAIQLGLVAENSADARDLVHIKNIVKKWLINPVRDPKEHDEENPEKATWLLVFDGVEDPKILNDCWPYNGPGCILITSRNPFSWTASIQLKPFTAEESTEFLMNITNSRASPREQKAMNDVSCRLGGLPLALAQMAGTIHHRQLTFSEVLESYSEKYSQVELLQLTEKDGFAKSSGYEHTIASVWAFDNLVQGAEMLNIVSMLDPDGIAESLLTAPMRDENLHMFPSTWPEFAAARHELIGCSLLSRNKAENKFFVHRLVQDVARSRMKPAEFRKYFMTCVRLISSLWPFQSFDWRHSVARWEQCDKLFPHIARLKDLFPKVIHDEALSHDDYLFAKLLTDAGWYHHERGRSFDADVFNNLAQYISKTLHDRLKASHDAASSLEINHAQLDNIFAEIQHNRGCIATEINEPDKALKYSQKFNQMMTEELGMVEGGSDMRLAISWNELGNAYMLLNEWRQGQECFEKSIALVKQLDHYEPSLVSLPMVNLGLAHWLQDEYDQAMEVLLIGLNEREKAFGPDDRISFVTGRFLHALGNVKADQGAMEESQTYHHRALLHYKFTLGNNHHRTADTLIKVAEHHLRQGQGEIALALIDHSRKIYASSSTNTYIPEKARALFRRSHALRVLNRTEEADNDLKSCFEVYRALVAVGQKKGGSGAQSAKGIERQIKACPEELEVRDLTDLITFWSK